MRFRRHPISSIVLTALLLALAAANGACGLATGEVADSAVSAAADTATPGPPPVIAGVAPFGGSFMLQPDDNSWNSVRVGLEANGVSIDPARCELYVDDEPIRDAQVILKSGGAGSPIVQFELASALSYTTPRRLKVVILATDGQRDTHEWTAVEGG